MKVSFPHTFSIVGTKIWDWDMAIEIVDTRIHDSIDISKSYSIDKIEIILFWNQRKIWKMAL